MKQDVLENRATFWRRRRVNEACLIVDARDYYRTFCTAARRARRTLLLSGWQFDTNVELLRGEDAETAEHPTELLPFLNWLCERNGALDIHILAWDYSAVYAVEREWLQKLKFSFRSHPRVHFEYWSHPEPGGSIHHKYVVVDDSVAFLGGLDICDARWDDRAHARNRPERVDAEGRPCKPFHDLQGAFTGELVHDVRALFVDSWKRACGEELRLPPVGDQASVPSLHELTQGSGLPLRAPVGALSRTDFGAETTTVREVHDLFEAAILAAERLIYIENQYFTSRAMVSAFARRLEDRTKGKLTIVVVMPDGGDTPKEDFVLGDRQRAVRYALSELAKRHGHTLRLLLSTDETDPRNPVATFIHSKLLIVDDEFLTVGSANLTNRSMEVDMEVNVTFQGASGSDLSEDIRAIRASLLGEHAGVEDVERFFSVDSLAEVIDRACENPAGKLRCHTVEPPEDDDPFLQALFDPSGAITFDSLEKSLEDAFDFDGGVIKRTLRKAGQRLGITDID